MVQIIKQAAHCANAVQNGVKVSVHYTVYIRQTNKKIESSKDNGAAPFEFVQGSHHVIKGWEHGLVGACAGDTRHLIVPSRLAYGAKGAGRQIPPNTALAFDIEVVSVGSRGPYGPT